MSPARPSTRQQRAGSGHSYYLDGAKVPGVTTVIGNGVPKPALIDWSAKAVAEYVADSIDIDDDGHLRADRLVADAYAWNATRNRPEQTPGDGTLSRLALAKILTNIRYRKLEEASVRGTAVHALAEGLARGEPVTFDAALEGYVDQYLRFLDDWQPRDALVERVVVNREWRYMGQFDLIATFPDLGTGLLDIKTGRGGIYGDIALQLAGYGWAQTMLDGLDEAGNAREVPMPHLDWFGALWLQADSYEVYRIDVDEGCFDMFCAAFELGDWLADAADLRSHALRAPEPVPA